MVNVLDIEGLTLLHELNCMNQIKTIRSNSNELLICAKIEVAQISMDARKLKVHKVLDFSSVRKIQAEKKRRSEFR